MVKNSHKNRGDSHNSAHAPESGQSVPIVGVVFVVGILALIVLGGVFFFGTSNDSAAQKSADGHETAVNKKRAERPNWGGPTHFGKKRPVSDDASSPNHRRPTDDGDSDIRWVVVRPDIVEESASPADVGYDNSSRDASGWTDPVNQRVLGQKTWMGEIPEEQQKAIEETLNRQLPVRYPIDLRVRRWSVDIATEVVEKCFEPAEPSGRFAVNYTLAADGGRAVFEDVHLSNIYRVQTPVLFAECVVDRLGRRSFASTEDGRMDVSRPFIFDEAQAPE